jgi:23S rRNA (pseudouridine1915-N3)-methyltransferase
MKVTIICVGKLKEKYWRDAIAEYSKRLSRYMKLDIIELADEKAPETMSPAQEAEVKDKEGQRILKNVKDVASAQEIVQLTLFQVRLRAHTQLIQLSA